MFIPIGKSFTYIPMPNSDTSGGSWSEYDSKIALSVFIITSILLTIGLIWSTILYIIYRVEYKDREWRRDNWLYFVCNTDKPIPSLINLVSGFIIMCYLFIFLAIWIANLL